MIGISKICEIVSVNFSFFGDFSFVCCFYKFESCFFWRIVIDKENLDISVGLLKDVVQTRLQIMGRVVVDNYD